MLPVVEFRLLGNLHADMRVLLVNAYQGRIKLHGGVKAYGHAGMVGLTFQSNCAGEGDRVGESGFAAFNKQEGRSEK